MPVPSDWSKRLEAFVHVLKQNSRADEHLGDEPFDKFVLSEYARTWEDFLAWVDELQGCWCFRGQSESGWLLHTSLDRAVKRAHSSGYDHLDREIEGRDLLFRFQQQARHYVRNPPPTDDLGSWFTLMQHHGVPTRLLDFSESPYVALYFAVEEEVQGKQTCFAVWAIDSSWLESEARQVLTEFGPVPDDPISRASYLNGFWELVIWE